MIDDKKLLCAFIYSAYESGYCGKKLDRSTLDHHMRLYQGYIQDGENYPIKEIETTQEIMMGHINTKGIRDYIYRGHFSVVVKRIEEESRQTFDQLLKHKDITLYPALRCPINFYRVIKINDDSIEGKNLFIEQTQRLYILDGLERPIVGDIISGHWNYFLEIVNNWSEFEKYKYVSKGHLLSIVKKQ